ncbi:Asp23/Gls24 family envelope stress response protein [Streptomyces armeniacus]|uniref:Asp23/Gls24 family envelope stress response protein n=1 Tax=Streptomyces armeniacus TaxID=83291 RepID=A0A345XJC4_9ACTN|nr:Asp23/Gls24 family envelope stress response protein [Streptomyces armeniacus]AXK31740.1 Asp23/Gls24 family envelope stress response protein [Streptomyces armeniacus]
MAMSADHGPPPGSGTPGDGPPGNGAPRDDDLLPCGRTLRDVWEAWDDGHLADDPHTAHCPHCTAALDGLRVLDGYVRSARSEDAERAGDTGPDGTAAAGAEAVATRVMEIVRLELRPGRTLPLGAADEDAWIVEAAAAKAFRTAAETLPGVRAGSCRITPLDPDGGDDGGADTGGWRAPLPLPGGTAPRGPVRVRLDVASDLSRPVPELAEAVRERVAEAAEETLGMDVRSIDVRVIDVLTESGQHDGGWPR